MSSKGFTPNADFVVNPRHDGTGPDCGLPFYRRPGWGINAP